MASDASAPARRVTLLLPTLNEIKGLRRVTPLLERTLFDDILVVDGGSTDGTVEYARSQGLRVERQRRPGLAAGEIDAVRGLKTDCVVLFSPDGNCEVERLPELVAKLREGYDLVTVSRYLPPAVSHDDTALTAFGNFVFSRLVRLLGRFPVTDALGMYRGFRCSLIAENDFEHYLAGPVFEPLLTGLATMHGVRMAEIPGDEPKRIGDASKMRVIYNGSCILLMILRLFVRKLLGIRV